MRKLSVRWMAISDMLPYDCDVITVSTREMGTWSEEVGAQK